MIRVTNNMLVNDLMRNLNNNYRYMDKYQRQLYSGKRINLPSDDPAGLVKSLRLRTNLVEGEQYLANINEALNFMETTDSTMDNIGQILHRIRDLTVKASNGTNDEGAHQAIADEIKELNEQLKLIANTTYGTKHVFGGRNVTEPPYQNGQWTGNEFDLEMEIGIGVKIPLNLPMKDFFVGTEPYRDDIIITDTSIINNITTGNLQSGDYIVKTTNAAAAISSEVREIDTYVQNSGISSVFGTGLLNSIPAANPDNKNASIELTISEVNTATGEVKYSYTAHEYDKDGNYEKTNGEFTLTYGGAATQTVSIGSFNVSIDNLDTANAGDLNLGDKGVLNLNAAGNAGEDQIDIEHNGTAAVKFVFNDNALNNSKMDLNFFSLNNGNSFNSNISMDVGTFNDADPAASFSTKPGIFQLVDELAADIEAGDLNAINSKLDDIDGKMNQLLYKRSTIGAKVNRLELQKSRLESTQVSLTGLLAENEDADISEVIMQLKMQENVYRASLAAGARIIQPSLIDFIR